MREVLDSGSLIASFATGSRCVEMQKEREKIRGMTAEKGALVERKGEKKITKNANFSPRPTTKGCCTFAAEDKSLRLCFSLCISPSLDLPLPLTLSDLLWVLLHGDRVQLSFWLGGHRPLPLGSLIYTTSGRIYWP